MDIAQLCPLIEAATKSLTPLSVTVVEAKGRIGTIRIIAEAYANMKLAERIQTTNGLIDAHDKSILKNHDLAFELLSPAEDTRWNREGKTDKSSTSGRDDMAAKDLNP